MWNLAHTKPSTAPNWPGQPKLLWITHRQLLSSPADHTTIYHLQKHSKGEGDHLTSPVTLRSCRPSSAISNGDSASFSAMGASAAALLSPKTRRISYKTMCPIKRRKSKFVWQCNMFLLFITIVDSSSSDVHQRPARSVCSHPPTETPNNKPV